MPKQAFLEAGQIVGTHGVRGEVRVQPWCDSPALFATLTTLYWDKAGASPVRVKSRPHKNIALAKLGRGGHRAGTPPPCGEAALSRPRGSEAAGGAVFY